jgi:hypothetical protein
MPTIWIKEFTGGLDTRRLAETTPGGVMIRAQDGHITRGGEFEKRAAFVPQFALPVGTIGLAHTRTGLVVFGHQPPPAMPSGVSYQRLQHPDGETALASVPSYDLYDGKIYAVAVFADGSVHHFYDGVRVQDWFDGRARASFRVLGGGSVAAVAAVGSFAITGGTSGGGNEISNLTVGGVAIIDDAVAHTGNNVTTAAAVAAAINDFASSPNYTATSTGNQVTITAAVAGAAANGRTVLPIVGGSVTVGGVTNMQGGADAATALLDALRVDGVSVIGAPVAWAGTPEATAAAIAAAVNLAVSTPEYTATAAGERVNIVAALAGSDANGRAVIATPANGLLLSATDTALADGADNEVAFTPGTFVRTIKSKMYSVSDSLFHFSGIQAPTRWTTDAPGAGFVNMATQNSGSEQLTSVARYQNLVAIFSPEVVQIWFVDPDPNLNTVSQVLSNTGTSCPQSVTQFGDSDLFYLDESGLRSLRARDSSNAAATTDIGVPVDDLIAAKLATLTLAERQQIVGLINPVDKRFWLIMKDEVFVFSFYANAKVSAWSTYGLAVTANEVRTPFNAESAVVWNRRVYLRSGDTVYVYGGASGPLVYDETEADAWLPYLDANTPTAKKSWSGLDAALTGLWEVRAAMEPTDLAAEEVIARPHETTYNMHRVSLHASSSHLSLRVRSKGPGPAVLSALVVHFDGDADET